MMLPRFVVVFLVFIAAACASEPTRQAHPALWEVQGSNGTRGWLFGTVHALPSGLNWQTPAIQRALDEADRLVFEIDPRGDAAMARRLFLRLGTTPGLPPLASRVRPDLRDELATLVRNIDPGSTASLEDWAAALTLAQAEAVRQGATAERGVEAALLEHAGDRPIEALETAAAQFAMFDALPSSAQSALLDAVVAESGEQDSGRRLLVAWARGDVVALEREGRAGMLSDATLRRELLVERNAAWARRLEAMLQAGKRPFVAVGAAHLAGADGVPALLASRGWKVTRVQ